MLRAETPERKQTKAHAPNATRVAYLDPICDYTSPSPFLFDNYLSIDTSGKTADMVASEAISAINQQVIQPSPSTEPKQRIELIDDTARKFVVNPIDYVFLKNNSAIRYLLETDWLIIGQDSEKKVVRKQFENGDVQMLLISKVTIDGKRAAKKEKLPKNSTTNIGSDLFVM